MTDPKSDAELMRAYALYETVVREAVTSNVRYGIDESGVITVGVGQIKANQDIVAHLSDNGIPFVWLQVGNDVRAEVRRRVRILQPEITP